MATKRSKKPTKKIKTLRAKQLSAKQTKSVRGGGLTPGSKDFSKLNWKY